MTVPITLSSYICRSCGLTFTSGAPSPRCARCNSADLQREGTAAQLAVPAPIPAGQLPDEVQLSEQIRATMASSVPLTYRCPFCGWSVSWPAVGDPPDSITVHQASHPAE